MSPQRIQRQRTKGWRMVLNPARNGTIVGSNAWQQYMRLSTVADFLGGEPS